MGLFISLLLVVESLSLLYVQVDYDINHSYIATVLCVNRDKPMLHCDGKCYLKKELEQKAQNQNENQKEVTAHLMVNLFVEEASAPINYPTVRVPLFVTFRSYLSPGFLLAIDHPPTA